MAAIGTALMGQVLGHSKAEKAFRPWSVTHGFLREKGMDIKDLIEIVI